MRGVPHAIRPTTVEFRSLPEVVSPLIFARLSRSANAWSNSASLASSSRASRHISICISRPIPALISFFSFVLRRSASASSMPERMNLSSFALRLFLSESAARTRSLPANAFCKTAMTSSSSIGDKIGDLAIGVVDGAHGGLNQTQIAEGPALVSVADDFQTARACGAQRFEQRLQHAGAGLRGRQSQIRRHDRLQFAGGSGLTLRVENCVDERRQIEQRLGGGLVAGIYDRLDPFRDLP